MRRITRRRVLSTGINASLAALLAPRAWGAPAPAGSITPAQYLQTLDKPRFREGHTLPPLSRFGWTLPLEARVELCENWGYALEYGGYADMKSVERDLADPKSEAARVAALCASNPQRYPLAVIVSRQLPEGRDPNVWTRDAQGKFLDGKAQSLDGTEWHPGMKLVYSPESPDEYWRQAGELRAGPLRRIREKCPIAVILNGGEYGLNVLGFAQKVWEQDPRILKARGETPWFDYLSQRKARFEMLISEAVRKAVPDRLHYIYYTTGGGTHRNAIGGWKQWCYGWEWMKDVSDLPTNECYYRHFNDGWVGKHDLLTLALNAAAREIADGRPLSYNWVCAGWTRANLKEDEGLGDLQRWAGLLKCYYTAGMIGCNAGYYEYPKGGFKVPFAPEAPPHWLRQMVVVGRVHATFSHLEEYLRDGDLLPGPDKHRISGELGAFEFPTGDAGVRVLARKRKGQAQWLITAWAADGKARDVRVTIPELGAVQVGAQPEGAIFKAALREGKPVLQPVAS